MSNPTVNDLIDTLSREFGHDNAQKAADALAGIIADHLADGDSVAIPGFGTFEIEKTNEYVRTEQDGNNILMPPAIHAKFFAGSRLKKSTTPNSL